MSQTATLNDNAATGRTASGRGSVGDIGDTAARFASDQNVCCVRDDKVVIAGVPIDNVSMAEAIDRIESMIALREPRYVVTPNIDHIVRVQKDLAFRGAYEGASLILADGMPLLWAARYLGFRLKQKVSGSDLFAIFPATAAKNGHRLYFMGGRPGAAQRSAEVLTARYPGLQVVGVDCPPLGFERNPAENNAVIRRIREARPDVLFVGLGTPKGELWIQRHHRECDVPVSIGIGASFDFVAGIVKRAPSVLQKIGAEWLWRLMQEPRRMYRRYLIDDPAFFHLVWLQKRTCRRCRQDPRRRRNTGRAAGADAACLYREQAGWSARVANPAG